METYTTAALSFRLTDVSLLVHLQIFCTILNEVASGNAAGWTDDWAKTRSASCRARDELNSTVATLSLSVTHRCNTVLCITSSLLEGMSSSLTYILDETVHHRRVESAMLCAIFSYFCSYWPLAS